MVGDGPDLERLWRAAPPNVELTGFLPGAEVARRLEQARAFLFAAEEDFRIVMVEAQACGTPVIAYGKGGACEVVRELSHVAPTRVLFATQTIEAVIEAVERFEAESERFDPVACRRNAERFGHARFCSELTRAIAAQLTERNRSLETSGRRDDPSPRMQGMLASAAR